jgi:hypothetical protein
VGYSFADVRRLLTDAFGDEEIETLCFDSFPEARNYFSAGMSKSDKIRRLLDYCRERGLTSQLLSVIQASRPTQYAAAFGQVSPPQLDAALAALFMTSGSGILPVVNTALLDQLIASQHQSMRYYLAIALALDVMGVGTILASWLTVQKLAGLTPVMGLAGVFIASFSVLLFREIVGRREKVQVFETIRVQVSVAERTPDAMSAEARNRLDTLVWRAIEKTALS